jgi:hypothetical protein
MHHNPSIPHDIHTLDRPLQKQGTRATVLRYHPQHPARFHSPRRKAMTGGGHKRHIYANSFRFAPRFLLDSLLIFMLPIIVIRSLISFSPHSFIDTPFMVTYTLIVATLYTRKWICITVWDTLTRIRVDNTERSVQAIMGLEMVEFQVALSLVQAISTSEHLLWWLTDRQTFYI